MKEKDDDLYALSGLMLEEPMIDMEGGYGEMWSLSWRCLIVAIGRTPSSSTTVRGMRLQKR